MMHKVIMAILFSLIILGCGEETEDTSSNPQYSAVLQFPIEGLRVYDSLSASYYGSTDVNGTFSYSNNYSEVSFYLGSQLIGTLSSTTLSIDRDSGFFLIQDITGSSQVNYTLLDNLLVLLASIDEDQNLSNGISVPVGLRNYTFSQNYDLTTSLGISEFVNEISSVLGVNYILISSADAWLYYKQFIFALPIWETKDLIQARNYDGLIYDFISTSYVFNSYIYCNDLGHSGSNLYRSSSPTIYVSDDGKCQEIDYRTYSLNGNNFIIYTNGTVGY